MNEKNKLLYAPCSHIKRTKANLEHITPELAKEIGMDYRVMPIFEKGVYDSLNTKHYSTVTNELLNCRWKCYKREIASRIFEPFQFLDARDYHFYNYQMNLYPSQSMHKRGDHRFKLGVGPGVDFKGQMPTPNELFMKRGLPVEKPKKAMLKKREGIQQQEKRLGKKIDFILEPPKEIKLKVQKRESEILYPKAEIAK